MWWSKFKQSVAPTIHEAGMVMSAAGYGAAVFACVPQFGLPLVRVRELFSGLLVEPFKEGSLQHLSLIVMAGLLGASVGVTVSRTPPT